MSGSVWRRVAVVAATSLVMVSCSGDEDSTPDSVTVTTVAADDSSTEADFTEVPSSTEEMRPVPTIPPSTIEGQTAAPDDGVVEVAPTLAPPPPEPIDPDEPATTPPPPTTEVIGDPQPSPDTTQPPPPPTVAPPPDPCMRLDDFGIADIVAAEGGSAATTTAIDASTCRIESGSVVAEVAFLPVDVVRDDWYRRDGIEPVGEVGGEAVGFSRLMTPSGGSGDGYTIAIAGGAEGVVVAVTGTSDARLVAIDVMVFANQAA